MPSHCPSAGTGGRSLDDGSPVSATLIEGNDTADKLARRAAERDRLSVEQRTAVRVAGQRLTILARWLGRVNAVANAFQLPDAGTPKIRDATGPLGVASRVRKRKRPAADDASGAEGVVARTCTDAVQFLGADRRRCRKVARISSSPVATHKRNIHSLTASVSPEGVFWRSSRMAALRQRVIERERLGAAN